MPTRARPAFSPGQPAPAESPPFRFPRPPGFPRICARGRWKARHSNQSWLKPLRAGAAIGPPPPAPADADESGGSTLPPPASIPPAAPALLLTRQAPRSHKSDRPPLPPTAAPPYLSAPNPPRRCPLGFHLLTALCPRQPAEP